MAQATITPKNTVTAVTGTSGIVLSVAGRVYDTQKMSILAWNQQIDADRPESWPWLKTSGSMYEKGKTRGWASKTTFDTPVMKTLGGGDSSGYIATPETAGRTIFTLVANRTALMSQASAIAKLQELCTAILLSPALQAQIVGYTPADA